MSVRVISAVAECVSWLPLQVNQMLGALLGRLAWLLDTDARKVTETNLLLCFPDMPDQERRILVKQSLVETGKQLTESAWIFHRPVEQTLTRIQPGSGQNLHTEVRASAKGLIMISPHIGNWELCTLPLSQAAPFTYFYRSPRKEGMGQRLVEWRTHLGGQPATLDAAGIRKAMTLLKQGDTLGILPDQEPDADNGQFAPFFGEPALTMTLLSKLARKHDTQLLFCVAERLPHGEGWKMHYLPADPQIASTNLTQATAALNRGVEQCIALCPAQYLWDYKRFNTLVDGSRRRYRDRQPG